MSFLAESLQDAEIRPPNRNSDTFHCKMPKSSPQVAECPSEGVGANDETTTTKSQAAARKEFARLPIGQQQRETASTKQSKKCDPGGWRRSHYIPSRRVSFPLCFSCVFFCFPVFLLVCKISRSKYEKRGELSIEDGSAWDAQTRWTKLDIVISISVNEGYTLCHVDQLFA